MEPESSLPYSQVPATETYRIVKFVVEFFGLGSILLTEVFWINVMSPRNNFSKDLGGRLSNRVGMVPHRLSTLHHSTYLFPVLLILALSSDARLESLL